MHDIKTIRDNPAAFDAALKRRGLGAMADPPPQTPPGPPPVPDGAAHRFWPVLRPHPRESLRLQPDNPAAHRDGAYRPFPSVSGAHERTSRGTPQANPLDFDLPAPYVARYHLTLQQAVAGGAVVGMLWALLGSRLP